MRDYTKLPENLPVPLDDGQASHLIGQTIPQISLPSTQGGEINLGSFRKLLVLFCYPMTGRPGEPLPPGWDDIPGARGCTPQCSAYRDHYAELEKFGAHVMALSTQDSAYQLEMASRLLLPYPVLSDHQLDFMKALALPHFEVMGMTLLKRLTLIVDEGVIQAVHYPVFPSDSDPQWVTEQLRAK